MDLRQRRYFVQIVESSSLATASRQLFVAQPALSQQTARLEDEVGKSLRVRSSRGVTPTENGEALYPMPSPCCASSTRPWRWRAGRRRR